MSPKPYGFASFRRCQLAGREVWGGVMAFVCWGVAGVVGVHGLGCIGISIGAAIIGATFGVSGVWAIVSECSVSDNQPDNFWEKVRGVLGNQLFWRRRTTQSALTNFLEKVRRA